MYVCMYVSIYNTYGYRVLELGKGAHVIRVWPGHITACILHMAVVVELCKGTHVTRVWPGHILQGPLDSGAPCLYSIWCLCVSRAW